MTYGKPHVFQKQGNNSKCSETLGILRKGEKNAERFVKADIHPDAPQGRKPSKYLKI